MASFDEAVGARIVTTDSNMVNVISLGKILNRCDKSTTVVANDLVKRAPSADDVFEYPVAEGSRVFATRDMSKANIGLG